MCSHGNHYRASVAVDPAGGGCTCVERISAHILLAGHSLPEEPDLMSAAEQCLRSGGQRHKRDCWGRRKRTDADVPGNTVPPLRGRRAGLRDDVTPPRNLVTGFVIRASTARPYHLPVLCTLAPRWLARAAIAGSLCRKQKELMREALAGGVSPGRSETPLRHQWAGRPLLRTANVASRSRGVRPAPCITISRVPGRVLRHQNSSGVHNDIAPASSLPSDDPPAGARA